MKNLALKIEIKNARYVGDENWEKDKTCQSSDSSSCIGTIYFDDDRSHNYFIFQLLSKCFATPFSSDED